MGKRELSLLLLPLLATCKDSPTNVGPPNPQSVSVLTQHNDNTRAGLNDNETALTTSNVNVQQFGKVFAIPVDGDVYAQPLVVGHAIGGDRNVVYVATVNNTVYAFDGDNGTVYWQKNFTRSGMRPPRATDMTGACGGNYNNFSSGIGIVGTPVVDGTSRTMYFVARSTNGSTYAQFLHAVNILDGNEVSGSPRLITATVSGNVYVGFSSHCDWGPYHGWILGYDAATLQQQVVYNDTPNGYAGGIWQSGGGMAADANGALYVVTGNGTVGDSSDATNPRNRGTSALKLTRSGSTLTVASYFTPQNYQYLNDYDLDYGTGGTFLIPNSAYYLTAGKDGNLYLLNKDVMGGFLPASNQVQQVVSLGSSSNMHCQASYYKGRKEFM